MTGLLLASLAGNIVVSLSWFGPGLTSGGPTFVPTSGPLLATFVLLQLVLMAWQAMRAVPIKRLTAELEVPAPLLVNRILRHHRGLPIGCQIYCLTRRFETVA